MSTAIITTTATAGALASAGSGVMNWLRSLLRAKPAALAVSQGSKSQEIPSYYKVGVRMELLRRAEALDAVSPQEAAELRKQVAAV